MYGYSYTLVIKGDLYYMAWKCMGRLKLLYITIGTKNKLAVRVPVNCTNYVSQRPVMEQNRNLMPWPITM